MSEPKFKVGDMAFSFLDGFGTILETSGSLKHHGTYYYLDGRLDITNFLPSLFTVEEAAKLGYFPPKAKKKIKLREALFGDKNNNYWITMNDETASLDIGFIKWIEGGREIEVEVEE